MIPYSVNVQFFGNQRSPLGPNVAQITQSEFAHDVAMLQFWADDVTADSYRSGMPMVLTFGRPLFKRTFYGYVNHASRLSNALANQGSLVARNSTMVTCVGASWFMKQTSNRVWPSQTTSQIVQQIADIFGLSASIVPDGKVWPPIPMAGRSYWQFCVMLANRIGYTFYCSGIQLVFKPRQTNPLQTRGLVASYDYRGDPGGLPVFEPTLGVQQPLGGELANRQLAGVNPRLTQVVYAQQAGSPAPTILGSQVELPIFRKTEHFTVTSQNEANARVQGAGQANQLYITACATASGNPLISQGSLIQVLNANGSQNGLWFVKKAMQTIDTKTYSMQLDLGRDSLGSRGVVGTIGLQPESPPQAYLSGLKWQSIS
jgi:phage protein D